MTRLTTLAAAAAALALATTAAVATTPAQTPKAKAKAKTAAKPAAAAAAAAALTEGQLAAADRVYTGEASCEFGEKVHLHPVDGKPGHFKLAYKKASYTLVPEETTTGAVRLEDKKAGIVWLQIPAKSMLMNSKVGQRMADNCLHEPQRTASAAPAAPAIGIANAKP